MRISAIVVHYRDRRHLPACLETLTEGDEGVEVLVVDNASGDGAVEMVRRRFPGVRVLPLSENRGYAGGANAGAELAHGEVLLFLNPDVELDPGWPLALRTAFRRRPEAGIVGGRLRFPDGRLQHAGGRLRWPLALPEHRGYRATEGFDEPAVVEYVTGACLAIRRSLFDELGGFDEAFFPAYFEEVDLCLRARAEGWTVLYWPELSGIHRESAVLGRHSPEYYQIFHRNRLRLIWKHRDASWRLGTFLPAEAAYLRLLEDPAEVIALEGAYRALLDGEAPAAVAEEFLGETPEDWLRRELARKARLRVHPPRARWGWLARLRNGLLRALFWDTLVDLAQQQSDFNASVLEAYDFLALQRRALGALVLLAAALGREGTGAPS